MEVVGGGATGRRDEVEVPRAQGTGVRAALRTATGPRRLLLRRETSKYALWEVFALFGADCSIVLETADG